MVLGLVKKGLKFGKNALVGGLSKRSGSSSQANSSILRYPYDIMDAETDYFLIEAIKYSPGGTPTLSAAQGQAGAFAKLKAAQSERNFILPIPNGIGSVNNTGWSVGEMNALAGTGVKALSSGLDEAAKYDTAWEALKNGGETTGGTIMDQTSGMTDNIKKYFNAKATSSAINLVAGSNINVNQVMARNSGQIINQNLELLFDSVSLRPFTFGWDIAPRDTKESKVVKEMLMQLKMRSSARKTKGDMAFLESPDVFRISYRKGSDVHPFLNKFKICALESVGVNYTGSGQYSTYGDQMGTPVHMKLNLSFKELEPIYREDYEESYIDF